MSFFNDYFLQAVDIHIMSAAFLFFEQKGFLILVSNYINIKKLEV